MMGWYEYEDRMAESTWEDYNREAFAAELEDLRREAEAEEWYAREAEVREWVAEMVHDIQLAEACGQFDMADMLERQLRDFNAHRNGEIGS